MYVATENETASRVSTSSRRTGDQSPSIGRSRVERGCETEKRICGRVITARLSVCYRRRTVMALMW